ncbi:MAG: hypothetical protein WBG35_13210, partial [Acidobacteriaceae bacterium]
GAAFLLRFEILGTHARGKNRLPALQPRFALSCLVDRFFLTSSKPGATLYPRTGPTPRQRSMN